MTTILFALASTLGAPHHAAPVPPIKALATWERCTDQAGCRWFPMPHAPRRPVGHWRSCSSSPSRTICRVYPLFQRPHRRIKPTRHAALRRPATTSTPQSATGHFQGTTARYVTTGYAPGCGATGATASGVWPHPGTAAAPPTISFGVRGYAPGYGPFVVEDRGGAIGPGRLDLYFPNCAEAMQWGVRSVAVTFYP